MRPLARSPWRARWAGHDASEVARFGLGFYCSACEQPLAQDAVAWHAAREEVIGRGAGIADWPDLLVLCKRCTTAALHVSLTPSDVLLPHRDLTFALAAESPLIYTRDDESGHVTVVPGAGRAAATVHYFALNGLLPEEAAARTPQTEDEEIRARFADYVDPRPRLRNEVWDQASYFARRLRETSGRDREELLGHVHIVAAGSGFWSVWATVLWNTLQDRDTVATLLQPPAPAPTLTAAASDALTVEAPPPTSHAFPATRPDWLPPAAP